MTNGQTYTQEQVNIIATSYSQEVRRLLDIKVNKDLEIFKLEQKVYFLTKELETVKSKELKTEHN